MCVWGSSDERVSRRSYEEFLENYLVDAGPHVRGVFPSSCPARRRNHFSLCFSQRRPSDRSRLFLSERRRADRKYKIVFYGVSGYTGSLIMEYLKRESLDNVEIAFSGRTLSKAPNPAQSALFRDILFAR